MPRIIKFGLEAIADVFHDRYLPIREHLHLVVATPESYEEAQRVLQNNGLKSLPVVVYDPKIAEDKERLITTCEDLDGPTPPTLLELADRIHVPLAGHKRDACILLYQLLLMITDGL